MFNFTIVVFDGTSPTFYFTNTSGWNTSSSIIWTLTHLHEHTQFKTYVPVVSVALGVRGLHRADRAADPCCRSAADTDHIWLPVSARVGSVVRRIAEWAGLLAASHRCWMVVVYRSPLRSSAVGVRRVWRRGGRSRLSSCIRPHSCRVSFVVAG